VSAFPTNKALQSTPHGAGKASALAFALLFALLLQSVYVPLHLLGEHHHHEAEAAHSGDLQHHGAHEHERDSVEQSEQSGVEVAVHEQSPPQEAHGHDCDLILSRSDSKRIVLLLSRPVWAVRVACDPGEDRTVRVPLEPPDSQVPTPLQARAPPLA
jgi:hypothetical protein